MVLSMMVLLVLIHAQLLDGASAIFPSDSIMSGSISTPYENRGLLL